MRPLLVVLIAAACGSEPGAVGGADAGGADAGSLDAGTGPGDVTNVVTVHPDAPPIPPETACTVLTAEGVNEPRPHIDACSLVEYPTRPPVGGMHYPLWVDWKTYATPIPWGFLVHNLEHGGVVITYACKSGCPEVVAALQAFIDGRVDAKCPAGTRRFVLVPDPSSDSPIAAAAWGHLYRATCLDLPSLTAFVDAHFSRIPPEDLCAAGFDDAANGWCP